MRGRHHSSWVTCQNVAGIPILSFLNPNLLQQEGSLKHINMRPRARSTMTSDRDALRTPRLFFLMDYKRRLEIRCSLEMPNWELRSRTQAYEGASYQRRYRVSPSLLTVRTPKLKRQKN